MKMLLIFHRVVRNTRNPVYEEDFTFYGLSIAELQSMSLHFVVLSFDRYSRDDVIGEVVCPFTAIDLSQIQNQQVALSREIQPRSLKVSTRVQIGSIESIVIIVTNQLFSHSH